MFRRSRVNKAAKAAEDMKNDVRRAAKDAKKKKGFLSRTFSSALILSAVGAGVKYFTDSTAGSARRQKVLSLVGKS
ncbi:MAG TPA: hypothetical protein VHI31_05915 [Actinomycetota bacterium]|nr:hypothetical protein [Actinomycetota bacterium]